MSPIRAYSAQEHAYITQKREEFSVWKTTEISKKLIKYLQDCSDELTTALLSLASTTIPSDVKLAQYHFISAKIQLINEILNLEPDIFAPYREEENV